VLTSNGKSTHNIPSNLSSKLGEIDKSEVKQISFGPDGGWAIVMKNGTCHCHLQPGPLAAVNENNNKIKYVALTARSDEWVVGFGSNGWKSKGLSSELVSYMEGIKTGGTIDLVIMGADKDDWIVEATNGKGNANCQIEGYDGCRLQDIW